MLSCLQLHFIFNIIAGSLPWTSVLQIILCTSQNLTPFVKPFRPQSCVRWIWWMWVTLWGLSWTLDVCYIFPPKLLILYVVNYFCSILPCWVWCSIAEGIIVTHHSIKLVYKNSNRSTQASKISCVEFLLNSCFLSPKSWMRSVNDVPFWLIYLKTSHCSY